MDAAGINKDADLKFQIPDHEMALWLLPPDSEEREEIADTFCSFLVH